MATMRESNPLKRRLFGTEEADKRVAIEAGAEALHVLSVVHVLALFLSWYGVCMLAGWAGVSSCAGMCVLLLPLWLVWPITLPCSGPASYTHLMLPTNREVYKSGVAVT